VIVASFNTSISWRLRKIRKKDRNFRKSVKSTTYPRCSNI